MHVVNRDARVNKIHFNKICKYSTYGYLNPHVNIYMSLDVWETHKAVYKFVLLSSRESQYELLNLSYSELFVHSLK